MGENGCIEGDIQCGSAIISGELKANIQSKELLILKETAKLYGDIKTEKLSIEPGAMFSGKCMMGPVNVLKKETLIENKNNDFSKEKKADPSPKKEDNKKENEQKV